MAADFLRGAEPTLLDFTDEQKPEGDVPNVVFARREDGETVVYINMNAAIMTAIEYGIVLAMLGDAAGAEAVKMLAVAMRDEREKMALEVDFRQS